MKYQQAKYSVPQMINQGISAISCPEMKASHLYVLDFFSRVSKIFLLRMKSGCIWLIHPGATKVKL